MEKKANAQLVDLNFKFKESDFLNLDLEEKKIGMFFSEKRIYNPKANVFFTLFNKRKVLENLENKIYHFYCWDTHFEKINPILFVDYIKTFPKNILGMVQTDFSAWYFQNEERKNAILKNFINLEIMVKNNFKVMINFNNIHSDMFELYEKILPKNLGTIVYDFNHNEDCYIDIITKNMIRFLKKYNVKSIIFITGKRKIPKIYNEMFFFINAKKIKYTFLPTEMSIMQEKKKRGIIK